MPGAGEPREHSAVHAFCNGELRAGRRSQEGTVRWMGRERSDGCIGFYSLKHIFVWFKNEKLKIESKT